MEEEKTLLNAVLCFLVRNGQVLLAQKTKRIGQGCWNGYGGGIESGESALAATIRELREEAGISVLPQHLSKRAIVDFHNTKSDGQKFICRVHVFLVADWSGAITESEEMISPTWFDLGNLPLDEMMPADKEWLPQVLAGKMILASAPLGPRQKELLGEVMIKEVDSLPEY